MSQPKFKPDLSDPRQIATLPKRIAPYWQTLQYCRHLGVQRHPTKCDFWVARVRLRKNGQYRQHRLAEVDFKNVNGIGFCNAKELAEIWFKQEEVHSIASKPYPVGVTQHLKYKKRGLGYSVGDAMSDYVEWKRVAAAKTTFESILSLINYHIIPRLGDVQVVELTPRRLTEFVVDVLETPPKYGRQATGTTVKLSDLDGEQLRKRKKTANTLLGLLKLALEMAWENGEFEEERIWRTIRRLPHKDAPRNIFLSRKQCRALLDHCDFHLGLVVQASLYTGCRISELANLLVSDVEPGIKGLYIAPSKSYRGRYVVLPDEGLTFFKKQCNGKSPQDRVFQMKSGRSWNGNHKHLFKAAVRAAGLPDDFVFHGLRHTYASQLVQSGTPLAVIAKQLGHANTDTVSRTYGHLTCKNIEDEIEKRFIPFAKTSDINCIEFNEGTTIHSEHLSWPCSNFSKATGQLVVALRGR